MQIRRGARAIAAMLALLSGGYALAAGGHHAVDDASILGSDECELESWFARAQGGARALHAGLGCRVGPVELGLAGEYARGGGASETAWGLEAKWAHEVADGVGVGLALQPQLQPRQRPRYAATGLAALATWTPRADLAFHANLGRDFVRQGTDTARGGVAVEWAPVGRWRWVAERYLEDRTHFVRGGVRWAACRHWSVDFSRAHRVAGPDPSSWTFGLIIGLGQGD